MKHSYTVLNALYGFMFGVALYFAATSMYWAFFPYRTAEIQEPIEILNEYHEVVPGEAIVMKLSINKESDIFPDVSRNVICTSGRIYQVENNPVTTARPKGEYTTIVRYGLSTDAVPGEKCVFQFKNEYKVNPIRTIVKVWTSEEFNVKE